MALKRSNPKKTAASTGLGPSSGQKVSPEGKGTKASAGRYLAHKALLGGMERAVKRDVAHVPARLDNFRIYVREASPLQRVLVERQGVPSGVVKEVIGGTFISANDFRRFVGNMPKATFTKKMKERSQFTGVTGQAVVGLIDLINMVEDMLAADPDNEAKQGFDVQKWVGDWIQRPQPALGGLAPAQLMDTPTGRESVMRVLGAIQSGAYQ